MITIATLLWDKNAKSRHFSQMYNEKWVTRLYDGCARNLAQPWRFVLFTDRDRDLPDAIEQERMKEAKPSYADCIEPFRLGVPMILMGLDTVIVGSIDHLAAYCLRDDVNLALPRDPNDRARSCNGVVLTPAGQQRIYENWAGENDMDWLRAQRHDFIDDLFPGQVISYKGDVKKNGLGAARIVYFHGNSKMHQLDEPWIRQHWLGLNG